MGASNRFGSSFNNRLQGSGGASQPFAGRNSFTDQMQNDRYLNQILQGMAGTLNQFGTANMGAPPHEFFNEFDPYGSRMFEDWEIVFMFNLSFDDVHYLIRAVDEDREIPIGSLFNCLY